MEDHLEQGHETLPLVIPMIYYNGLVTPYPYSTDIFDYFANRHIAKQVLFKPIPLIDVNQIPDEALMEHQWAGFMELLLKHMKKEQDFLTVLERYIRQGGVRYLIRHDGQQYAIDMIYLMLKEAEITDKEKLIEVLETESTAVGERVMTLLQTERQEGRREQAIEIAQKMLVDEAQPIAVIAKFTGLTPEEIQQLKSIN